MRLSLFVFRRQKTFLLASLLSAYSFFISALFGFIIAILKFQELSLLARSAKSLSLFLALAAIGVEVYYNYRTYMVRHDVFLQRFKNN
jgi:hypothetical protein